MLLIFKSNETAPLQGQHQQSACASYRQLLSSQIDSLQKAIQLYLNFTFKNLNIFFFSSVWKPLLNLFCT